VVKDKSWRFGAVIVVGLLTGCGGQVVTHGHIFTEEDLRQIRDGMTREQVTLALGTPDTKSTVGSETFYYISTTEKTVMFMEPQTTDRRVVAVYFTKNGTVQRIANYGMKDGRIIDFVSRETPSHGSETGLLKELFRNIGRPGMGANPD
jgi:outer membrane protein assembly factor BamE (lipoprotein component of BamABCDE complex)